MLGLTLRLIGLGQSLWLDEATSALVVRNLTFSEIISKFLPTDFHPPLYYLVLKAWSDIFGTDEIALRLLSVIFGLLTILVTYFIGKEIKSKTFGVLASFLLAIAPLHVYYSQEVRMYMLSSLFVSLAVYFYIRICKKPKSWEWIGFSSSISLVFLTDYVSLLILPVFWLDAYRRRKKFLWRKFLLSHILLLVSIFALWPVFWQQLSGGVGVKSKSLEWWNLLGTLTFKNILLIPIKFMIGRIGFTNKLVYGLVVALVGGVFSYFMVKSLRHLQKRDLKNSRIIWYWLVVPLVFGVLLSFFVPVLTYFRFIFVLPALYILVAWGVFSTKEKFFFVALSTFLFINFVSLAIYYKNDKFHREDWRGLTDFIENESAGKNSKVIFVANSQMEGYRYYRPDAELGSTDDVGEGLDQIWLMRYVQDVFDPGDSVRYKIEDLGYQKVSEHNFNGVVVWRYEK